ncbi:MAG: nucleotidyltransferase domain-containing protein [Balneolaceae bacterium]
MTTRIELKMEQLNPLCKKYSVKELYLFGSAASGVFTKDSDLDFIVKFNRRGFEGAFDQFLNFKNELEQIYKRPVDLYHLKKFRNPIFQQEVDRTKQLLYAA